MWSACRTPRSPTRWRPPWPRSSGGSTRPARSSRPSWRVRALAAPAGTRAAPPEPALPPVRQACGQRCGQPGGEDRLLRALDVVLHAPPGRGPLVRVEQQERRAPVAVTGLADRAGIEQVLSLVEPDRALLGIAAGRPPVAVDVCERHVAVADHR